MARQRIVIVGGGVAGTTLVRELRKRKAEADITLIEPREYFEVPFAQLRGLTDPEGFGRRIRKSLTELLPGTEVIRGRASSLANGDVRLEDGRTVAYDWLVLATGSRFSRWAFLKGDDLTVAERETAFMTEGRKLAEARSVLIVGGGPVGVEFAGEVAAKWPEKRVTLVQGPERLLASLSEKMSDRSENLLLELGVRVEKGRQLSRGSDGVWKDDEGQLYQADMVIPAVGIDVNSGWLDGDGGVDRDAKGSVTVGPDLRVTGKDRIFALGDLNDVPEIKIGALAAAQAKLTTTNLVRLLRDPGARLKAYKPAPPIGMITIGPRKGSVQLPFGHPHFMIGMKQKDMFTGMYLKKG